MQNIATCGNKLSYLDLSGCLHITDIGIMNMCKGNGFNSLKKLKFSGMP